jgi:hypothetical protein
MRRRVRWASVGQLTIGPDFLKCTKARGLDLSRSLRAWAEVWSVLQQRSPGLQGRIGQCGWCGRFFYRYRLNAQHCSSLCGLVGQVLAREEESIAGDLTQALLARGSFKKDFARQFGPLDKQYTRYASDLFRILLGPVLLRLEPAVAFPDGVSDPEAFVVVWRFVFNRSRELAHKLAVCPTCGLLFWRYRKADITCSRVCQMRRYRARCRSRARPQR